jgi:hypothetical protein
MALAVLNGIIGALDVKCCAMRDRSNFDASLLCAGRPAIKEQDPVKKHKEHAYHYGEENRRHKFNAKVDGHSHSTKRVPIEVVDKIAKLMENNPYIAREMGERVSGSMRYRFLKSCSLRRHDECERIWSHLNEKDRLDFLQVLRLGNATPDGFFLNMMLPDEHILDQEINEYASTYGTRSSSCRDYPLQRGDCSAASNSSSGTASTRCSENS